MNWKQTAEDRIAKRAEENRRELGDFVIADKAFDGFRSFWRVPLIRPALTFAGPFLSSGAVAFPAPEEDRSTRQGAGRATS
jgi:hypothetical protein